MSWAGHVAHKGERRGLYRALVGKPDGKRQLGRPRHRWEEVVCGGMGWIEVAQDRYKWQALVSVVTNLRVP